jgi:hypothetical protein
MAERMYGLYERPRGTRRWTRLFPEVAYPKASAVRIFQSALLAPFLDGRSVERCLRPIHRSKPRGGGLRGF